MVQDSEMTKRGMLRRRISRRRALAVSAAGGVAAVAGATGRRSDAVIAAQATPTPRAAPGEITAERVAQAVERIPALAEELLQRMGVPGMAVAVVYDDAVQYSGGFGVRELGKDAPIDAETVFQLASVSKSLSATVVSSVVGTGEVTWLTRMADLNTGFALNEAWPTQEVSLADLFSHRSGLRDHGGDLLEDLGFDQATILHRLRYLAPEYSFREGYAYTNFGLTAAAVAAAKAAGATWEDLSDERLYKPLGMTSTSSRFSDFMARDNRAIPHVLRDGKWQVTPLQRDPDPEAPAGGASSNVTDLVNWMRLQLGQGTFEGKELIPAAALAPMHIPQAVSNVPANPAKDRIGFYGLGSNVSYTRFGTPQWSHSGAFNLGAATAYYLLPAGGFGVMALTNGEPIGAPEAFCLTLVDIAQGVEDIPDWIEIVGGAFAAIDAPGYGVHSDWTTAPAEASSALANDAYTGIYYNDYFGDIEVATSGNGLVLRIGPKPLEFPLTHFDRDIFTWQPIGENAYGLSGLTFSIGGNDRASGFSDQYLASGGAGDLARKHES
jgi:CubicO group peptidase (beta-lactamase class C family)